MPHAQAYRFTHVPKSPLQAEEAFRGVSVHATRQREWMKIRGQIHYFGARARRLEGVLVRSRGRLVVRRHGLPAVASLRTSAVRRGWSRTGSRSGSRRNESMSLQPFATAFSSVVSARPMAFWRSPSVGMWSPVCSDVEGVRGTGRLGVVVGRGRLRESGGPSVPRDRARNGGLQVHSPDR